MSDGLAALLQKEPIVRISEMQKNSSEMIRAFYMKLKDWLSDLLFEEKIIITSFEVKIGQAYYMQRFSLIVGEEEIKFIPNKITVGITGKIEMKIKKMKILIIRDRDGVWKQVLRKSPLHLETLTRTYFRQLIYSLLLKNYTL